MTSSAGLGGAEENWGLIGPGLGTSVAQSRKSGLTGAGRSRGALSCSLPIGGAISGTLSQSSYSQLVLVSRAALWFLGRPLRHRPRLR